LLITASKTALHAPLAIPAATLSHIMLREYLKKNASIFMTSINLFLMNCYI